jgi:hypothetical protein
VIVAIGTSPQKNPETHLSERIELCREVLADVDGVEVDGFNELLVDYVRRKEARFILRGIRTVAVIGQCGLFVVPSGVAEMRLITHRSSSVECRSVVESHPRNCRRAV